MILNMVKTKVMFRVKVLLAFEEGESLLVSQIWDKIAILLLRDVIIDYYDLVIKQGG